MIERENQQQQQQQRRCEAWEENQIANSLWLHHTHVTHAAGCRRREHNFTQFSHGFKFKSLYLVLMLNYNVLNANVGILFHILDIFNFFFLLSSPDCLCVSLSSTWHRSALSSSHDNIKSCVIYWNNCRWLFAFIPIIASLSQRTYIWILHNSCCDDVIRARAC